MATEQELTDYVTQNPSYHHIHSACAEFAEQVAEMKLNPEYIVGLSRGGLIPATILSHMTDIPLFPVKYSSKSGNGDNKNHDNNLPTFEPHYVSGSHEPMKYPDLLIVDDISDSGKTLREVVDFYEAQGHTVHTAALYYKALLDPVIIPDMVWRVIPEDGPWILFPWER